MTWRWTRAQSDNELQGPACEKYCRCYAAGFSGGRGVRLTTLGACDNLLYSWQRISSGSANETHTMTLPGATSRTSRHVAVSHFITDPSAALARPKTSARGSTPLLVGGGEVSWPLPRAPASHGMASAYCAGGRAPIQTRTMKAQTCLLSQPPPPTKNEKHAQTRTRTNTPARAHTNAPERIEVHRRQAAKPLAFFEHAAKRIHEVGS